MCTEGRDFVFTRFATNHRQIFDIDNPGLPAALTDIAVPYGVYSHKSFRTSAAIPWELL